MRDRLTLRAALHDLGWFPATFAAIVGGPSVLALLQIIFVEHRLIDALQWIVDGYNDIVAVIGNALEPLLMPVIAWLNGFFDWRLVLHPHWKPFLMLVMTFVAGLARTGMSEAKPVDFIAFAAMAVGAFLGAVAVGLVPLNAGWWAQGLAAAAPWALVIWISGLVLLLFGARGSAGNALFALLFGAALAAIAFVLGAGLTFVPGIEGGAGLLASGLALIAIGVLALLAGFKSRDALIARVGLTMLGGFVAAGMILAADAGVKALGG